MNKLLRRPPLTVILAALAPVLLVAGLWLGGHPQNLPGFVRDTFVVDHDTTVISAALDQVQHDYYRPLARGELVDASIAGMVSHLGDRFSTYFTPGQYRQYTRDSSAMFSGVGMTVQQDPRGLIVRQVYDASPASRAHLVPGDLITTVDRHPLKGVSDANATALIKGRPGTDVRLTIVHRGVTRIETLTRATLAVPVVSSSLKTYRSIKLADTALATFAVSGAHGQLRQAIDRELKAGARGIVLDLRGNGGGLVDEARLTASIFLPDGTIVTTRGRTQPTQTLTATGGAISTSIPVVVLVNGDTASASEIVAGALQDRHRATVVGTHTFGKGVFQEVSPLLNGGALDITVGEYFTPSGRNLGGGGIKQGAGIVPDVPVSAPPHARGDIALQVALRTLAAKVR